MSSQLHASEARAALAYVCENADEVRKEFRKATSARASRRLVRDLSDAVAAGHSCTALLDAIHAALQEAGDALGLYGRLDSGVRSGVRLAGVAVRPPAADETLYLCPAGQCSRSAWNGADPAPKCTLTGQPLREDRL